MKKIKKNIKYKNSCFDFILNNNLIIKVYKVCISKIYKN